MGDSNGYSLRRGYSPHRSSPQRRNSRNFKKKTTREEEDQEESDAIHVATYNDSPEHLYGLDKHEDEEPPTEIIFKFNPFSAANDKDTSSKKSLFLGWLLITVYILALLFLYHKTSKAFFQKVESEESKPDSSELLESLLQQINLQKTYIDQVTESMANLHQNNNNITKVENCTCQKPNLEEYAEKSTMENLQKQILSTIDVVKKMNERVNKVQVDVEFQQEAYKELESKENGSKDLCNGGDCLSSSPNLFETIHSALDHFHADVLALPDFAMESAGGSINIPHHSETCEVGAPIIKVFGLPLWQDPRSPRNVIQPDTTPGNCWPMQGTNGYIVIKLAVSTQITMVTLEHLDRKLDRYSTSQYQLAPREFDVYAWLDKEGKEKFHLGSYVYLREKSAIQTFNVQNYYSKAISYVELRVKSNYGNPDCTCLYRFRVHGLSTEWDNLDQET
ncbi:SUN domain-containing protein 3-like [Clytia hemisphaerica]|uniref:SUN domain-containing protein n=1 Tax=Clytia hemisphaerica TaxID=252671 RepID=A0A7M5X212_9CNID